MTTFAESLKKEISRIARKELKGEISALRKGSSLFRAELAELKRKNKVLEAKVKALSKAPSKSEPKEISPESPSRMKPGPKVIFGAPEFVALRHQLGFTQAQMAKLIGVSSVSIFKWESGQVTPRAAQLEKIMAVRKIGKREANKRLEA